MKHARAHEVFAQVVRKGPALHMSVADDGVGFDVATPGAPQGLWLAGICTRVGLLRHTHHPGAVGVGHGRVSGARGALGRGPSGHQGSGYGVLSQLRGVAH